MANTKDATIDNHGNAVRLHVQFWQSPFAVTAAAVVTAQIAILIYAIIAGRAVPFDMLFSLTVVAITMLAAGIWPGWNFLELDPETIEQHSGLSCVKVDWSRVRSVDAYENRIELRFSEDTEKGPVIKSIDLPNRYGLTPEGFADLVEAAWRKSGADPNTAGFEHHSTAAQNTIVPRLNG